jgi:hypothetical protein
LEIVDDSSQRSAWREYAAWGSLVCGPIALLGSLAAGIHSDHFSDRLKDPWFGWYLLLTGPVSILGLTLRIIGKDSPRVAGVVLSGSMLLVLIACAASA